MSSADEIGYESTTKRLERGATAATPCALIEDLLPLYIEGEVSPGSRDVIVEHLAQCAHCAGFMAGAQSVRAQLRQEQRQRAAQLAVGEPERKVVAQGQRGMAMLTTAAACLLGFLGSMMFMASVGYGGGGPGMGLFGLGLGMGGCVVMLRLSRKLGLLTPLRVLTLVLFWGIVSLVSIMITIDTDGPMGLFVWLVASLAIWMLGTSGSPAVAPAPVASAPATPRPKTTSASDVQPEGKGSSRLSMVTLSARQVSGLAALGLVVVGSALGFSWLSADARLISTMLVIGLGAYLWSRDR